MAHFTVISGRKAGSRSSFTIHEDNQDAQADKEGKETTSSQIAALPLGSSKRGNIQRDSFDATDEKYDLHSGSTEARSSKLDDKAHKSLLKALEEHCNLAIRVPRVDNSAFPGGEEVNDVRNIHANKQDMMDNVDSRTKQCSVQNTVSADPGMICYNENRAPTEMEQLKLELETAKQKIATQEQELTMVRTSAVPSALGSAPAGERDKAENTIAIDSMLGLCNGISSFDLAGPPKRQDIIAFGASNNSHFPEFPSQGLLNSNHYDYNISSAPYSQATTVWNEPIGRNWSNRYLGATPQPLGLPSQHTLNYRERGASRPASPAAVTKRGLFNEYDSGQGTDFRRPSTQLPRWTSGQHTDPKREAWEVGQANEMYTSMGYGHLLQSSGLSSQSSTFGSRSVGTTLSPTAHEFTATGVVGPWNATPSAPGQTYVPTTEPLNYRRLLDRSVSCNWKYIVDKIVCNNDQQASIFLQQKLKIGTVEQKYEIVEAIVAQAYPLMVNRFGNFLVQRCFEHGTPEQVVAIANAIRGNTLNLSMDAFGCHVVQKAFDAVPEEYKAIMVHELLRRIPETVIHRYACHVWQKLFELRWSDSPPQIMKHVNEALRGMWHEVALGETGSLVVQNIFENCLEEDKRPCIEEVLKSIDIIAHGQFGNWCIQHVCEHGAPADRSRAIDHVLCYASEYSMDQFASKVVEKCLKIGGSEFLERYLERVCEGRTDRPRIPLIDIASDQYGNYLIQYILTHVSGNHREIVASHIRKHMVSLRGSKFGSRVGMLCSNPAYATRPGPGVGPSTSRFSSNNPVPRFQNHFR